MSRKSGLARTVKMVFTAAVVAAPGVESPPSRGTPRCRFCFLPRVFPSRLEIGRQCRPLFKSSLRTDLAGGTPFYWPDKMRRGAVLQVSVDSPLRMRSDSVTAQADVAMENWRARTLFVDPTKRADWCTWTPAGYGATRSLPSSAQSPSRSGFGSLSGCGRVWSALGLLAAEQAGQLAGLARYSIALRWLSFGLPARAGGTLPRLSASARELPAPSITAVCKNPLPVRPRPAVQTKGFGQPHRAYRIRCFFHAAKRQMTVYVLVTTELDCTSVCGVSSSRVLAENAGRELADEDEVHESPFLEGMLRSGSPWYPVRHADLGSADLHCGHRRHSPA
jgi:hypothetical protein